MGVEGEAVGARNKVVPVGLGDEAVVDGEHRSVAGANASDAADGLVGAQVAVRHLSVEFTGAHRQTHKLRIWAAPMVLVWASLRKLNIGMTLAYWGWVMNSVRVRM